MPRQARLETPDTLHQIGVPPRGQSRRAARAEGEPPGNRQSCPRWERLGPPGRPLAAVLGVRPQAVYQAGGRGRHGRAEWDRLLDAYLVLRGDVPYDTSRTIFVTLKRVL